MLTDIVAISVDINQLTVTREQSEWTSSLEPGTIRLLDTPEALFLVRKKKFLLYILAFDCYAQY